MDDCGALIIVHLQNMATARNCALHLDNMLARFLITSLGGREKGG